MTGPSVQVVMNGRELRTRRVAVLEVRPFHYRRTLISGELDPLVLR